MVALEVGPDRADPASTTRSRVPRDERTAELCNGEGSTYRLGRSAGGVQQVLRCRVLAGVAVIDVPGEHVDAGRIRHVVAPVPPARGSRGVGLQDHCRLEARVARLVGELVEMLEGRLVLVCGERAGLDVVLRLMP